MIGRSLLALAAGTLFGGGLAISGMADPTRVHAFLAIFGGGWDPTLGFVMAGAIIPMSLAWLIRRRMERPLADKAFNLPDPYPITTRLTGGAALFGIGWGLSGLCPGPAIADLALRPLLAAAFVATMLTGFALYRLFEPSQGLHHPSSAQKVGER